MLTRKKNESLKSIFSRFELNNFTINSKLGSASITYTDYDGEAAWQLYVELLTRICTQPIQNEYGDEKTALESIYSIFSITRDILKQYGKKAQNFTKISIIVLNQLVRPFTTKWHTISIENGFKDKQKCNEFRLELEELRINLLKYSKLLAEMAKVEDLTYIN